MGVVFGEKGVLPLGADRYRCGSYPDGSPARTAFNWIIWHSSQQAVDADRTNDAEALAKFLATPGDPNGNQAGYNALADTDGWYRLCDDSCRAFAAPPTNGTGLHICLPVRVPMSRAQWVADDVRVFIDVAAAYTVTMARKYGIPLQRVTPEQMKAGVKGYADHLTVTRAFGRTDHTDLDGGVWGSFPWDVAEYSIALQSAPDEPAPEPPPPPPPPPPTYQPLYVYTVKTGDTLWGIAQRHRCTVSQIKAVNCNMTTDIIRSGQTLAIPGYSIQVCSGDGWMAIARRAGVDWFALWAANQDVYVLRPGMYVRWPA